MPNQLLQSPNTILKVVLFGPESTGKTTLSQQLAEYYQTALVPEYLREFAQKKWDKEQKVCEEQDVINIAKGQMQLEKRMEKEAKQLLICDTDLLETKVYAEYYFNNFQHDELDQAIAHNHYDLYLLTYIDTPWQADDLRDRPEQREQMFALFENALIKHNKHYLILKGDKQTRLQTAINAITPLLK